MRIYKSPLTIGILPILGLFSAAHADTAEQSNYAVNQDAAAQAVYSCPADKSDQGLTRAAAAFGRNKSETNAFACAADLRVELSNRKPEDKARALTAMMALADYINYVTELNAYDFIWINGHEYDARNKHASDLALPLIKRVRHSWPNDVPLHAGAALLSLALEDGATDETHEVSRKFLEQAAVRDPALLDGLALKVVARSYFELAPILGGDVQKAIELYTIDRKVRPTDLQLIRYLAEGQLAADDKEAARAALRELAAATANAADLQTAADEWRMGEGLSDRLGNSSLARRFGTQRVALLESHPQLQRRASPVGVGHGGANPLDDQPQYMGERPANRTSPSQAP
jgi:hypothetical protein